MAAMDRRQSPFAAMAAPTGRKPLIRKENIASPPVSPHNDRPGEPGRVCGIQDLSSILSGSTTYSRQGQDGKRGNCIRRRRRPGQ
jgi:hypothetical protein